jgi:hypothetical protein
MIGLSKLRQYKSQDPIKYLQTEMRQNLLSIEKTCNDLLPLVKPVYVGEIAQKTLSATASPFVFTDVVGVQKNGAFELDVGDYLFDVSLNEYAVTNGVLSLVLTTESESTSHKIIGITSGTLSGSTFLRLSLYIDKKITINGLTTGSASSIGNGLLIISKVNI